MTRTLSLELAEFKRCVMNTCDANLTKTRDEARYLSCSGFRLKNERPNSKYYLNSQQNISQNSEHRDITKNDTNHVNSYFQNKNIFVC